MESSFIGNGITWSELEGDYSEDDKQKLSSTFVALITECVLIHYRDIKSLGSDNNDILFSMFKNMVNLYNMYVDAINGKKYVIKDKTYNNIDNKTITQTTYREMLVPALVPAQKTVNLGYLELDIKDQIRSKLDFPKKYCISYNQVILTANNDDEEESNDNTTTDQVSNSVNAFFNKIGQGLKTIGNKTLEFYNSHWTKKSGQVPSIFKVERKIKDISVFGYLLNKINDFCPHEKLEIPKLDFILIAAYYFLDRNKALFNQLQERLLSYYNANFAANKQEWSKKQQVKWKSIKNVISLIRKDVSANFKIPYDVILYCVLGSDVIENYSIQDLQFMFDCFDSLDKNKNKNIAKIYLLNQLAENKKKTIVFYCMPDDFTDLLKFLIQVSGNSFQQASKESLGHALARSIHASSVVKNIDNKDFDFQKIFIQILSKIHTTYYTAYAGDKYDELNFYKKDWQWEVYSASCDVVNFISKVKFEFLPVMLEKFYISEQTLQDKAFDARYISKIIDKLHTQFKELISEASNIINIDKKQFMQQKLSALVAPIQYFYGNFVYPIMLYFEKQKCKPIITPSDYTKLIQITNGLAKYNLMLINQNKINSEAKNISQPFENASQENLPNQIAKNPNKIIQSDDLDNKQELDIKNINRFDIYQINYKLVDIQALKIDVGEDGCSILNLNDVFLWYKYFISNGQNVIQESSLYNFFCLSKSKSLTQYNSFNPDDIQLAVDFMINIAEGKNFSVTTSGKIVIDALDDISGLLKRCIRNCLSSNDDNFDANIKKFYDLVKATTLLYFANFVSSSKKGTNPKYSDIYDCHNYCLNFIDAFDSLFEYIEKNPDPNKCLLCKFYLTKAINAVECAYLENMVSIIQGVIRNNSRDEKDNKKKDENVLKLWNKLYYYMLVFEKKRQLCAFEPSENLMLCDKSIDGTSMLQLLQFDFINLQKCYLLPLLRINSNENSINYASVSLFVKSLLIKIYLPRIIQYQLPRQCKRSSLIEASLMTIGEIYKMFPFTDISVFFNDVYNEKNKIKLNPDELGLKTFVDAIFDTFDQCYQDFFNKDNKLYSNCFPSVVEETKSYMFNHFKKLVSGNNFERYEWPMFMQNRLKIKCNLINKNDIEAIIKQNDILNSLKGKVINLIDCNKILESLLSNGKIKDISITELSNTIADCINFNMQNQNDSIKSELKKLFEFMIKICESDKKLISRKIRLDDIFQIIQAIFADTKITPDLIDIFTDKNLFEPASLSLENLDKMARMVKYKDKYNNNDLVVYSDIDKRLIDNFKTMVKVELDAWTMSSYLDLISVFYCKKINYDKNTQGTFTALEIQTIIGESFCCSDNWYDLCEFIRYNWAGYDIIDLSKYDKYIQSDNGLVILEFLKALQEPVISVQSNLDSSEVYSMKLKSGIQSINRNIICFASNRQNNNNEKTPLDISEIVKNYMKIFSNTSILYKLNDNQWREVFAEFEKLLETIRQYSCTKSDYIEYSSNLLDSEVLLKVLIRVKNVTNNLDNWCPVLRFVGNRRLKLSNPLEIVRLFCPCYEISKTPGKKFKDGVTEYLNILPFQTLSEKDFLFLLSIVVECKIKLNKEMFTDFIRLIKGKMEIVAFNKCLNILDSNTENFDDMKLKHIINHVNLDVNKIADLAKALSAIRKHIRSDFPVSFDDENTQIFIISKAIANTNAKNLQDKFKKLEDVLEQILKAGIKLKVKELNEIFSYYGVAENALDIRQINNQNSQTNLNLFKQCVSIISRDEYKREIIVEKNKNEKDKTENLGPGLESKAVKFLMKHFIDGNYNFLQMDNDNIVNLIVAVLSGDEEADEKKKEQGMLNLFSNNKKVDGKEKQKTVLNLLCLFWTPVKDNEIIAEQLTNQLKRHIKVNNDWIDDTAFQKNMAVMYFAKHLYSLLIAVQCEEITLPIYKNIASSITKLQSQMSGYNEKSKTKITKENISDMYNKMIINSKLPFKEIEGNLFNGIKDGILDLIVLEDSNKCVKYDEKKIIISFAILNQMRLYSDQNINYNYQAIFNYVTEVIKDLNGREKYPLDLETLKFVFDQMLGRGDSQGDNNKLSISFDEAGKKLFNAVLDCLDNGSVEHSELFDFLQEYFFPLSIYVQPESQAGPWYKRFFANLKRVLAKLELLPKKTHNNKYLTMKNLIAQKDNNQQKNNNNPQVNQPQLQFQLNADNVFTVMKKSKNHFLFYSSKSQEDNSGNDNLDNNFTEATKNFLNPVKNDLLSSHIIDFVGKFRFQDIDSFEDFMKQYWKYDKLFSEDEITQIYTSNNFCQLCRSDDIKQCIVKLMFAKKIDNYNCENEKNENNHNRELLAHLVQIIKDSYINIRQLKRYCLAFYNLDEKIDNDAEKIEELYGKIDIMFGNWKEYTNWGYGLLFVSLVAVVCLIILCSSFNPYLLILFIMSGIFNCFCIRELYQRKKFNDEIDAVEGIKNALDETKINQFYIDKPVELDFPSQEEIQNQEEI